MEKERVRKQREMEARQPKRDAINVAPDSTMMRLVGDLNNNIKNLDNIMQDNAKPGVPIPPWEEKKQPE